MLNYYGSTSFGSAKNVINYFDYFHLLSSKHINYLKWRKAYLIIQNKEHLKPEGLEQILKIKEGMNRKRVFYGAESHEPGGRSKKGIIF